MKKNNSNRIKSYEGSSIKSFENFGGDVTNRYMKSILEGLADKGHSVLGVEHPEWGSDGLIELTENTSLTVVTGKSSGIIGQVEYAPEQFARTTKCDSLDEALEQLGKLKAKHSIVDADYTTDFKKTAPRTSTPLLRQQRVDKVGKAVKLIESAIRELKRTPKLDMMTDIPEMISRLEKMLGEDEECGLNNLHKLYENKK